MIFSNYSWHQSDQPEILKKADKELLRKGKGIDVLKILLTNIIWFAYLFVKFVFKQNNLIVKTPLLKHSIPENGTLFYGICVNLDKGEEQIHLIEELGAKSLQIRFFLSDIKIIDKYVEFLKSFGSDKEILICVIQSREHIVNEELLNREIKVVFEKFSPYVNEFMIGNAVNRIKWGFATMEEYLQFFETVQRVRDKHFPNLKLIGSSVIDFEYYFTIRTLFNGYQIHFDKISSLLYVDRRGSPKNTQYGIFDLKNKVEFLDTIVKSSNQCDNSIYITEVNWPLKNTAPYSPTSEKECIGEEEYATFLLEYFDIVVKTKKVEKVFWHQLISPGYGLVDNRNGKLRKTKAFYEFKKIIENSKNEK